MTQETIDPGNIEAPPTAVSRGRGRGWLYGVAGLGLAIAAIYGFRAPIADQFVADQLNDRKVPATYQIGAIGLQTQRLTNLVIGDPARPDLTADVLEIDLGWRWSGPYIRALRAERLRLFGAVQGGRLTFGALDRFRDPLSDKPLVLPDMHVSLYDARARIQTPWGAVGARLDGDGHARHSFAGKLALAAPALRQGDCAGRGISFYGDLRSSSSRPRLSGPLRAISLACSSTELSIVAPEMAIDVTFSDDLAGWAGKIGARTGAIKLGGLQAANAAGSATGKGSFAVGEVDFDATATRVVADNLSARVLQATGTMGFGGAQPQFSADVQLTGGAVASAIRQQIVTAGQGVKATPIGPMGTTVADAAARALVSFTGTARVSLAGAGRTRRIEITTPSIRSASGARLVGGRRSQIAVLLAYRTPLVLVDGDWQFGGGGLPAGQAQLNRNRQGIIRGEARLAPLVSGKSRLAVLPIRFSSDRGGTMRVTTLANISGPVAGGRVDGLAIPVDASIDPNGDFRIAGGCRSVAVSGGRIAGLALSANRVSLCSVAGQPLAAMRGGHFSGVMLAPTLAIAGATAASPVRLIGGPARFDVASGSWSLANGKIIVGDDSLNTGEASGGGQSSGGATSFSFARVDGRSGPMGQSGRVEGGSGAIGSVPLLMSDIAGAWQWGDDGLSATGGLLVSDGADTDRFSPLRSGDAAVQYRNGNLGATASFAESRTGAQVLTTEIAHNFENGVGQADLFVRSLRFNDGFQPDQLSPLALGIIANTEGAVNGRGEVRWSPGRLKSSGTFTTAGTNFAAAFGPVRGASTTIVFDDLIGLHSEPGQRISLDEVNPGIAVIGGLIDYQLLDANRIQIEGGRWPFAGGELSLRATTLDFGTDQPRRLVFELSGVDSAAFLQEFGFENINASGVFDGVLPVEFDGLGGRIVEGLLVARAGGGTLSYVGELTNQNLGVFTNFAFNSLKALRYTSLTIGLNGDLDGEMVTDVRFAGLSQGEGASRNIITRQIAKLPIIFNVRISAPFRQLISSAKSFYDPSILIEQNLQALMRENEAAQRREKILPVQPAESETVP